MAELPSRVFFLKEIYSEEYREQSWISVWAALISFNRTASLLFLS